MASALGPAPGNSAHVARSASKSSKKSPTVISQGCAFRRRPAVPASTTLLSIGDMYAQFR